MTGKDIDKIIARIRKLFALSKSPNANEAAAAMEKAQQILQTYNLTWDEADEIVVAEEDIASSGGYRPPKYEVRLIVRIADAFGCGCAYGLDHLDGNYKPHFTHTFAGVEHKVKIAAFLAVVLLRKLKNARRAYVKKPSRVRIRANKISRADAFCLGWVATVTDKLRKFANTPQETKAVDRYEQKSGWQGKVKTVDRGFKAGDFSAGLRAGRDVEIQHGVKGPGNNALLLERL
ncbi:MAG: DUF2786 domain-containing protein [Treponema sp.]|jgi:hypothetical protein|nr:DUF2786 domain-containing protein [Treponema sp.]